MEKFDTIFMRAAVRHGGEDALRSKIAEGISDHDLSHKSDNRWLAEFTKRVFQSGFSWKVVEAKWEGFETAFWGFDISKCARIEMDDLERLTADAAIIRNAGKIKSVKVNAQMIQAMTEQAGSADAFIRDWAGTDFIGLLEYLNKNGSRLGPNTACYALRFSGVPSFILSKDVVAALKFASVIDKEPTSKMAKRAVQEAFNVWCEQSGENLSYVSRILALSIDAGG
ncbi:MAG: DNA-3-methyladenine glycosylase I [Maricaulaceae bacterium]